MCKDKKEYIVPVVVYGNEVDAIEIQEKIISLLEDTIETSDIIVCPPEEYTVLDEIKDRLEIFWAKIKGD